MSNKKKNQSLHYPLLPLRDVVVFPHMVIPLFVGRAESIKSLDAAMDVDKQILLVAQKDPAIDVPKDNIPGEELRRHPKIHLVAETENRGVLPRGAFSKEGQIQILVAANMDAETVDGQRSQPSMEFVMVGECKFFKVPG